MKPLNTSNLFQLSWQVMATIKLGCQHPEKIGYIFYNRNICR